MAIHAVAHGTRHGAVPAVDDPKQRLALLATDKREAKARLRDVLEELAEKYDIPSKDVTYAIDGYADDMLSDLFFGVERDLEHQVDAQFTS